MSNTAERLAALASSDRHPAEAIAALELFLVSAPAEALFRLNPLDFAQDHGLTERQAIDLFVHATRLGLFEMSWNVLCLVCGAFLQSVPGLRDIGRVDHCAVCDVPVVASLDDAIEVSFTVSPTVRPIPLHDNQRMAIGPDLLKMIFSRNRRLAPSFEQRLLEGRRLLDTVARGQSGSYDIVLEPGVHRIVSATHNAARVFEVAPAGHRPGEGESHDRALVAEVHEGAIFLSGSTLSSGPGKLTVRNLSNRFLSFSLIAGPPVAPRESEVGQFRPFLSGKRLLTSQAFHALFGSAESAPRANMALRSLTVLFTDLKDSTRMYDRMGDLDAYDVVQEHFGILAGAIGDNEGAIVKTIGDAVMAAFPTPESGLRAAIDIQTRIGNWNEARGNRIEVKVGLHAGPCIAINSNDRLDYFGQTVNQAARIQGLADGGQIYLSDTVYDAAATALAGRFAAIEPRSVALKGITGSVRVYRATPIAR